MIFIFTALSLSSTISFSISSFNLAHIWMFLRISYLSVLMVLLVSANSLDLFHASFLPLAPRWGRQRVKGRGRQRQLVSPSHRPHDLRSHLYLCAALSFVGIQYASKRDALFHCRGAFFFRQLYRTHLNYPCLLFLISYRSLPKPSAQPTYELCYTRWWIQFLYISVDWEQYLVTLWMHLTTFSSTILMKQKYQMCMCCLLVVAALWDSSVQPLSYCRILISSVISRHVNCWLLD
jgi:hypothetical protein